MDRPPSKEEVLLEWFLGDSKEIAADLKAAAANAQSVRDGIITAKGELDATVQAATRELVATHRELAQTLRDAKASSVEAARSVAATSQGAVSVGVRRSIPLLLVCCGVTATIGATLGAAVAILLVRHLV